MKVANRIGNIKPSAIRELLKLTTQPDMISFAGGLPALDCLDRVGLAQAAARAMDDGTARALQYGVTEGDPELLAALEVYLKQSRAVPAGQRLLMTSGSQQAIDIVCRSLLNSGDVVLVESPTYMAALQTFGMAEVKLVALAERTDGAFSLEDLELKVREHRPKVFYVLPTFSNPSGRLLSESERLGILALAEKYGFWILEDDPYRDLYFDVPPPPSIFWLSKQHGLAQQWCLYMSGASKVIAPGLRLGWLAAPQHVHGAMVIAKQSADLQAPSISQRVALEYLRSDLIDGHLALVRHRYRQRATSMDQALRQKLSHELEWTVPQGGMFLWARQKAASSKNLLDHAIKHGVLFVPGESFFVTTPASNWMRFSFASASEGQVALGVDRLVTAFGDVR